MRVKSFNKSDLILEKLAVFPQVQKLTFSKNDTVIREKEECKGFYLVVKGEAQSIISEMNLCQYKKGMAFGFQFVLEKESPQVYTCICNTDTELLFIRSEIAASVLNNFPEMWKILFDSASIEIGAAQKKSRINYSLN